MSKTECTECPREAVARGLCLMHYKRLRRRTEFAPFRPQGRGLAFLSSIPNVEECVEYPFGRFSTGYGHVKYQGRSRTAHAVAFEMHCGPIPDGMEVCHNCGNRPCVNPRHLRADTHAGNMADTVGHGTHTRGNRNGNAKLNPATVGSIREMVKLGRRYRDVANEFGIHAGTVGRVARHEAWVAD